MPNQGRAGWFVNESDDEDRVEGSPYQPFVQLAAGCFPLPIWFRTEADCQHFIDTELVGLGRLDA